MSCLLSKFCSIKSTVQLRKLSVPANSLLARRTFNRPNHNFKRFQSQSNSLLGPSLFCISVCTGSVVLASVIQYERLRVSVKKIDPFEFYRNSIIRKNENFISKLKNNFNKLQPSEKVFGTILLLNAIVFLAWQVPQWQHIMIKYFMTDALARKIPVSSLLLSAFSHSSPVHFCFNMYALHTFCRGVIQPWGEMGPEEFTAMYISGCVVSSLASIIFRRSFKFPGNSLGASGAILSVVGYFSLSNPDQKLGIIFLPNIQFDAIHALFGIISLDIMGLLLKWQMFDHAAHLGGTLFGMFWYKYMSTYVWNNRKYIVGNWIKLKQIVRGRDK
ncbi:presenilins-associated rhomboid-like protein, mitochondrial [Myzus persicae]|uniref:presenilins-associated rhomboid-like protein, mitochondrial n=1 Tax=Myzus persicae TaxID=13164 RepID=UPI000B934E6A|nr:presenilins-associated rhomboid-like protein, mitochondrial [Myzus persicae]XP_022176355.1 presenilins-associated rhomboid-like protein, mitochondrial [Myzus persicae]